jgi:hypothetical protein
MKYGYGWVYWFRFILLVLKKGHAGIGTIWCCVHRAVLMNENTLLGENGKNIL